MNRETKIQIIIGIITICLLLTMTAMIYFDREYTDGLEYRNEKQVDEIFYKSKNIRLLSDFLRPYNETDVVTVKMQYLDIGEVWIINHTIQIGYSNIDGYYEGTASNFRITFEEIIGYISKIEAKI